MLIRHQLSNREELAAEYELMINLVLVKSLTNWPGPLTTVPQQWLAAIQKETEPMKPIVSLKELDPVCIQTIHQFCGRPGVKRTLLHETD